VLVGGAALVGAPIMFARRADATPTHFFTDGTDFRDSRT
jgi:hypothetical protein